MEGEERVRKSSTEYSVVWLGSKPTSYQVTTFHLALPQAPAACLYQFIVFNFVVNCIFYVGLGLLVKVFTGVVKI